MVSNIDGGVEVGGVSVERCFVFVGTAHAQRGDDPFRVIPAFDPGEDRQFGVVSAGPAVPVDQLGFRLPKNDSATALSKLSPTDPVDGATPAPARR